MEETGSKRNKRAPSFTVEEMGILVDQVWQHRDVLFGGTRDKKNITVKNRVWQAIAEKMSPSSPCGLRDWVAVRKKWQEFQSQTKKKSAKVRRESTGTGGGEPGGTTLTPDEEKVLYIIRKTASEGTSGGVDVQGDEGLSESEDEEEPSGSGAGTCTPPGEDDPPQPCPVPAHQPAGPGVRMQGGSTGRPAITTCSETLVRLERKKLAVLRGIEGQLQRQTALQEEMVRIKQERLELHRRQLALAEAQFNRPSISVPVILPQDSDVQQPLVVKEEGRILDQEDQQDQEDPEPPHIKEELEEADVTKFPFTPVKREDDEEEPQPSQLHQRHTGHMELKAAGEDCGGPGPHRDSDPGAHRDSETGDSSESEVNDDDWTETREPQSGLNSVINNNVSDADRESFICALCGKPFGHKTNLKRHIRVHMGEKPFSCSFCGKSFNRREHLIAHVRCHSGEKPFSCSVCDAKFSHSWSLEKHVRVHTGEKPFGCSRCSKRFRQRSDLVAHFRIHTGAKPFSCSVCSSSFTQRHTLVQHSRTHTGAKPFSCSACGKTFSRKGHLTRHMAAHTGEKPFSCSVCDKSFTWQSQFKRHDCSGATQRESSSDNSNVDV